jgi:predicted RND superfamily exporter protein
VLTTALGFAGNIFGSIGLIRDFAVVSTCAILANGLITLLLVPMMLVTFGPRKIKPFWHGDQLRGLPGMVARLFGLIKRRHSNLILVVTALLCAFFLYQATRLQVSNDLLSYFRDGRPLIRQVEQIHRDLSGMKLFFVTLESEREKAFLEPKNIRKLAAIQAFLEKQEVFDHSVSLADHLP